MQLREADDLIKRLFSGDETSRNAAVREMCIAIASARTRIVSGLSLSAASSAPTTSIYRCKFDAAVVMVDGEAEIIGALDPLTLIGTGAITAVGLDGAQAVVLAEAGQAVAVALVIIEGGAIKAVFGEVDDSGSNDPSHPTADECRAALLAAGVAGWDRMTGLVAGRLEIERHKVITYVPAGTIIEGSEFAIVINGTAYTVTADSDDDASAVGGKFRTAIGTNETGVAVSGSGANVILTADAGTTFTSSSTASGEATLVGTQADAIGTTFTNPATDEAHRSERECGSLYTRG